MAMKCQMHTFVKMSYNKSSYSLLSFKQVVSSQPSVTLVPGDTIPSSGLYGHSMHMV